MIKSPSQAPGTWRPATSAGRSSIDRIPMIFEPFERGFPRGLRCCRHVRKRPVSGLWAQSLFLGP
jgi:hypothetical protein